MARPDGRNPRLAAELLADLTHKAEAAADAASDILWENVGAGPRSGEHYAGLPRPSSAANEFPQEQFGDLRRSVGTEKGTTPLVIRVGFFGDDMQKLANLEFAPPSQGGRKPLARTMSDSRTMREMAEAMEESG